MGWPVRGWLPAEPKPGWILIAIAALFSIIVIVPTIGISAILLQRGLNPLDVVGQLFAGMNLFVLSLVLPSALLMLLAIVFLVAFALRATWGPRAVSIVAMAWVMAATASRMMMPALAMHSGLPPLTWLGTLPNLLAPFVLTLGLIGFLTTAEGPRAWFSRQGRRSRP